jgi:pyrroline-5-carboxylate reductase
VTEDNLEVVRRSNIVILAVKPQQFAEVVAGIAPTITRGQLIISIAAGITLRWLQERLPDVPLVRVMPNLPATVGCGFSAVVLGRSTGARHRAKALALFQTVGEVVELPERHLDAITAVSGSGPAYVFFLVQMWEAAAASLGLPRSVAERAIRQTLEGSLRLLQASGEPASVLMGKVASKRGTTEAALKVLARQRVSVHFMEALRAAARRSKELSWS